MINKTLEQLGLNESQIKVYLALLSVGTSPASILARRLNMPRSTARYTCQQLANKGVVIMSNKNNALLFTAKDPTNLVNLLEDEYQSIQKKEQALNSIMDELKNRYNPSTKAPKVLYYEGISEVINMLELVLEEELPTYGGFRLDENIPQEVKNFFIKEYAPRRKNQKVLTQTILNDTKEAREYIHSDLRKEGEILLIPEKDYPFSQCFHIYGNKVAFYAGSKHQAYGVIIEDERIKDTQLALFKMAWSYAASLAKAKLQG